MRDDAGTGRRDADPALRGGRRGRVVALWERCGLVRPTNDPHRDIRRKLEVRPDLFLVGEHDGPVIATVMAGYEGHRGWLNYVAVEPAHQRQGFARSIVAEAERRLRESGCPKINLQIRTSNRGVIEFYRRIGYTVDDVVSMGSGSNWTDRTRDRPLRPPVPAIPRGPVGLDAPLAADPSTPVWGVLSGRPRRLAVRWQRC